MRREAKHPDEGGIFRALHTTGPQYSLAETARLLGVTKQAVAETEKRALKKLRAKLSHEPLCMRARVQARDAAAVIAFSVPTALPEIKADAPLPKEIVWMPAGTHAITAGTVDGETFAGKVIVDERASTVAQSGLAALQASGQRTWLDMNHDDGAAVADVRSFSWDATRGIIAHLEWTPRGEAALRNKEFSSFSPTFEAHRTTGRVMGLIEGHALGGLVNAPAFKAMPALIAARFGGLTQPAPGGKPENKNMKEQMLKILAALKVSVPADSTEDQIVALFAKSIPADASADIVALKKQIEDAQTVAITAKKASDAKIAEMERKLTENEAVLAGVQARVTVTGSDMVDVLAAYAAKDPAQLPADNRNEVGRADLAMERAHIWAHDIAPRVQKESLYDVVSLAERRASDIIKVAAKNASGTVKLFAANSLGTLSGSLIAQNALSLLKADLPGLGLFTTDFSNASAKLNQSVVTRLRTIPAVQSYSAVAGYVKTDVTATDVPVSITSHRYVQFDYNVNELASTSRDLFGEQAEGSIYSLGKDMLDSVLALFTLANFPLAAQKSVVTLGNFNRAAIIAQRVALRKRKVQIKDGFLIANEDYFGQLAQDAAIVSLATYQRPELISEYVLPKIAGFQPTGYVDLPTTGFLTAIAGAKESAIIACRLPYDYVDAQAGSNYGNVSQITDPNTGMSVMLTQYVNHDAGASRYRVARMYGSAVGDTVRAQLVTSA